MLTVPLRAELARPDLRRGKAHVGGELSDLAADVREELGVNRVARVLFFFAAQEHQFLPAPIEVRDLGHNA